MLLGLSVRAIVVAFFKIFLEKILILTDFISDGILFQNFIELYKKDVVNLLSLNFGLFK